MENENENENEGRRLLKGRIHSLLQYLTSEWRSHPTRVDGIGSFTFISTPVHSPVDETRNEN